MKAILFSALLMLLCRQALAQAPANDDCSNATTVQTTPVNSSCTTPFAASTANATAALPAPGCGAANAASDDIWYRFTATASAVMVRITNAASIPSGLAVIAMEVYSGSCGALTSIYCNAGFTFGSGNRIVSGLTPGNDYYIRFWTQSTTNAAGFDFCLQDLPDPPANDHCSGATAVSLTPFGAACSAVVQANTLGATGSTPAPSCTGTLHDDDIWYQFTATSAAVVLRVFNAVRYTTNGPTQIGFALYGSSCPASTATLACSNFITAGSGFQILTGLVPGTTYYLRFWEFNQFDFASFEFCIQETVQPANDECQNAVQLSTQPVGSLCNSGYSATTVGSTPSAQSPPCTNNFTDDDIWYRFTAVTSAVRLNFSNAKTATAASGNANLGYALYQAACPTGTTTVACDENIGGGSGSALIGGLVPGNEYYLRLFAYGVNSYASFDFCLVDVDLPLNDECHNAVPVPVSNGFCSTPVAGNLENATTSPGMTAPSCAPLSGSEDIWFKLTVPASGALMVQTSPADPNINNLVMEAYAGSCGALALISCDDDGNPEEGASAGHARIELSGRTPGETIYLRVLSKGTINFGPFAICAWDPTIRPAVSEGGNCINGDTIQVSSSGLNRYRWIPVFDSLGRIIAEIYPDGSVLNDVAVALYVNQSGTVRSFNGKHYLDRNISVKPTGTGGAKLRLYFRNSEFTALQSADLTIASFNNLQVAKTGTDCGASLTGPVTANIPAVFAGYGTDHYAEFDVGSFSSFFITTAPVVLPLHFVYVSASAGHDGQTLEWKVMKDESISHFDVQWSGNGNNFETIGSVNKVLLVREETDGWVYQYKDRGRLDLTGFYRVVMRTVDGQKLYSPVTMIHGNRQQDLISVYPNPVQSTVMIKTKNQASPFRIRIFSIAGVEIKDIRPRFMQQVAVLDVHDLLPGVYILQITNDKTGDVHIEKMTKQ